MTDAAASSDLPAGSPQSGAPDQIGGLGPPENVSIAPDYGIRFWVGVIIGWAIIAYGIHSAYRTPIKSRPVYSLEVLVLLALIHDLVVAPAVVGIGLGLRRILPGGIVVRVAVGASIVSVIVTAFTWGEIRGYGKTPSLQSLQLGNYATGLLTVLGVIWGMAAVIATARVLLARRSSPGSGSTTASSTTASSTAASSPAAGSSGTGR